MVELFILKVGNKEQKKEQQVISINRIIEVMEINAKKTPIKITYGGTLLAGSGVGASAASCVSLARALNAEFDLGYTITLSAALDLKASYWLSMNFNQVPTRFASVEHILYLGGIYKF